MAERELIYTYLRGTSDADRRRYNLMTVAHEIIAPVANGGNLSEGVYRQLRSDIVHGVLRPNERLIELDLAARLAVSRTPIRESLQRLAADGLIVSQGRGWIVYEFTASEIGEIYETRIALEGYAALLAAERAREEQVDAILAILRDSENYHHFPRGYLVTVNDEFHEAIIAAANNRRLADTIERNRLYYFNYHVASLYTDEEVKMSRADHEQIASAIRDRDSQAAEALVRSHIERSLTVLIPKVPPSFLRHDRNSGDPYPVIETAYRG